MIVLDVNLLLYAHDSTSERHSAARMWLGSVFSGPEPIGLPWQVVWAFLRLTTNPRIFANSLSMEKAVGIAQQWMELKQVRLLAPGERHWSLLQKMLIEGQVRGPLTNDAELAALTIEYGGVLHTTDRDFARFPGLRWVNPLLESGSS
ncbi:MAG: type II toxin-antitoxin system VapC family toxin [Terracidiphilus sp.]